MEQVIQFFSHHFVWGLCLGLLFFGLSVWGHFKTKREFRRYRRHLSDKLELEARQYELIRREKEVLAKENENLRLRIGQLSEKPEQKLVRDLEILTRAEKRMMVQAPGFAGAWESAKSVAVEELAAEDQGKSLPKRLFSRIFGSGGTGREALPQEATAGMSAAAETAPAAEAAPPAAETR